MSKLNVVKRAMPVLILAVISVLASCSSPGLTGMKVHMQNMEYQETVHLADSMIATGDSTTAEVWFWRGRALVEMNQWMDAAESFEKAYNFDTDGVLGVNEYLFAFYNSAAAAMSDGDMEKAEELIAAGVMVAPERPDFQMMQGDIELSVNDDLQAALENFDEAAGKAGVLVEELRAKLDESDDPYEIDYYSQNLDQAIATQIQSLYNTGSIYTMMALDADEEQAAQYIGMAEEAYLKALEIDATNVDMLDALASAYMIQGDYDSALQIFDQAFENIDLGVEEGWLSREDADALTANMLVSKGYAYIEMESYDQAIEELEKARDLIGDDYIVLSTLAHANFVMENYENSLSELDAVLLIDNLTPDELGTAYYTRYACFNRMEMDEEAAAALETALQFIPDNANWWRYLASTYSRLNRRSDAIEAMEMAEELDPTE